MTTTFRRSVLSLLPALVLVSAGCDSDGAADKGEKAKAGDSADGKKSDAKSSKSGGDAKKAGAKKADAEPEEKYAFSVKIGDAEPFTEAKGRARVTPFPKGLPGKPKPSIDINARKARVPTVRFEFREMEIKKGPNEVFRMNVGFSAMVGGKEQLVGCGGNEGTPDDLMMEVTAFDDTHLSGTIKARLTSCHDYDTAETVDYPGVDFEASLTDVPYREAEE
ncbi:MAG: hypothetical protein AAF799_27170 [Myxococcota bacterium]